MIISNVGRFFWRHTENNGEPIFSGKMVLLTRDKNWKYWDWDLGDHEILLEVEDG